MEKNIVDQPDNDILGNNKVDVEIEPDVKANRINIQMCSLSIICNCFSGREKNS